MLLSPIRFCPFLEEFPPHIPSEPTFLTLRIFESPFWYRMLKPISTFFYYIHEYRGFNKISLIVENSALLRQFFIVFLRELFCFNEEHFLMNKTYHKNCFVRGSPREVFCK